MTRWDPVTGEPDPYTDTWLGLPISEDERPTGSAVIVWIVGSGLLSIALGLALVWVWTR